METPLTSASLPAHDRPPVPDLREVCLKQETVDEEIWPIFDEEAREILEQIEQLLRLLPQSRDLTGPSATLARLYHTIKGTARTLGLQKIGWVAYRLEVFFKELPQAPEMPPVQKVTRLVILSLEVLKALMEQVRTGDGSTGPLEVFQDQLIALEDYIRPVYTGEGRAT